MFVNIPSQQQQKKNKRRPESGIRSQKTLRQEQRDRARYSSLWIERFYIRMKERRKKRRIASVGLCHLSGQYLTERRVLDRSNKKSIQPPSHKKNRRTK